MNLRLLVAVVCILNFIQPIINGVTLNIKCPHSSHWKYRGGHRCSNNSDNYICLFDENNSVYKEHCNADGPEIQRPGFKVDIKGGLDKAECQNDRFQPFKFTTKGNSDCALLKSKCTEEGQLAHNDGNASSNRLCKCDFFQGYAFVVLPSRTCFCDPDIEDCSCYKIKCPKDHYLFADYKCRSTSAEIGSIRCSDSSINSISTVIEESTPVVLSDIVESNVYRLDKLPQGILGKLYSININTVITVIFIVFGFMYICPILNRTYDAVNENTKQINANRNAVTDNKNQICTNLENIKVNEKKIQNNFECIKIIEKKILDNFGNGEIEENKTYAREGNGDLKEKQATASYSYEDILHFHLHTNKLEECEIRQFEEAVQDMKKRYRDNNNYNFCVLLLVLLCKNRFEIKWLDETNKFSDRIEEICEQCLKDIKNIDDTTGIKRAFKDLQNTFVNKNGGHFCLHPDLFKTVVVACVNTCFECVLKYIDVKVVAENYRFESSSYEGDNDKIVVSKEKECLYFERLVNDLRGGEGYSFFYNFQMYDRTYRIKFKKYVNRNWEEVKKALKDYMRLPCKNKDKYIEDIRLCELKHLERPHFYNLKTNLPLIDSILGRSYDLFELLVNQNCDVNEKDEDGRSALFYACALSRIKFVRYLLLNRTDTCIVDRQGQTVLHVACTEGNIELVKILLEEKVDFCINCQDSAGRTPLYIASIKGHSKIVEILIQSGADPS